MDDVGLCRTETLLAHDPNMDIHLAKVCKIDVTSVRDGSSDDS